LKPPYERDIENLREQVDEEEENLVEASLENLPSTNEMQTIK